MSFADLDEEAWYDPEVCTSWRLKMTDEVNDHSFAPDRLLTRQELAVLSVRAYESYYGPLPNDEHPLSAYVDSHEVANWAVQSVNKALVSGLMSGLPGERFAATRHASRAEAALMIARLIENHNHERHELARTLYR